MYLVYNPVYFDEIQHDTLRWIGSSATFLHSYYHGYKENTFYNQNRTGFNLCDFK